MTEQNDTTNRFHVSRRSLIVGGGALSLVGLGAAVAAIGASGGSDAAGVTGSVTPTAGDTMAPRATLQGIAFADDEFDGQFLRALDVIPYGGADFGEAYMAAKRIPESDREAWYTEWTALADRLYADAEASLAAGRLVSAREGFFRASTYYRTAGIFMFVPPISDRFRGAYEKQKDAFRRATEVLQWSVQSITIPVDGTPLDAYYMTPAGNGPFPVIVLVGGYDGTKEEMFFMGGEAALRRGYAILSLDGPGQGGALIEHGLYFRPDWESVVSPEIDWLLTQPNVDPSRIVLLGRSWGGFLAPRAATAEHRVAAVIADAPQYAPGSNAKYLLPEEYQDQLYTGDEKTLNEALYAEMKAEPALDFILNRGMVTHGVATPLDYLRSSKPFTLEGIAADIRCPVLLTTGENDPRNTEAQSLFDALTAPKEYIRFTNAEGAGEHDEGGSEALFSQRAFDWLDGVLNR